MRVTVASCFYSPIISMPLPTNQTQTYPSAQCLYVSVVRGISSHIDTWGQRAKTFSLLLYFIPIFVAIRGSMPSNIAVLCRHKSSETYRDRAYHQRTL